MRVLVVHNAYTYRGGEDSVRELEERLLVSHGHQVDTFLDSNDRIADLGSVGTAARTIWSSGAYRGLRQRLRDTRPDVVHVHNTFPLISPAAYYAARHEGVPVVQTLHNYRLLCLNSFLYRDGHVCEDCVGRTTPWPGVLHACYRDSRPGSLVVATMLVVHRALGTWRRMVDAYIVLTEFERRKMLEAGLPTDRIHVKPNFVDPDPGVGPHAADSVLFVGRLSPEKGIVTLLAAWRQLPRPVPLRIIGTGPLAPMVEAAAAELPNVEWLGPQPASEVARLMGDALAVIFPSEWYETFGRVAIEAQAVGTPVIAANIGAIAELVGEGRTGIYFAPGDAADLAARVDWAWTHRADLAEMGRRARQEYEAKYTAEKNYAMLMAIYRRAIARGRPNDGGTIASEAFG